MAKAGSEGGGGRRSGLKLGADLPAAYGDVASHDGGGPRSSLGREGSRFSLLWFAAGVVVIWEWQRLVGGGRIVLRTAIGAATLLIASPLALHSAGAYAGLTTLVGAVATGWAAERGRRFEAGAGVVYAGVMTVGANLLRASPEYGFAATLWLFAVVWGTDVMAYAGGRLMGAQRWPRFAGEDLVRRDHRRFGGRSDRRRGRGARFADAGQITRHGARGAHRFRRRAGRRSLRVGAETAGGGQGFERPDPGHGGLMDRLDSFIVAVALTAAIGYARASGQWIAAGLFQW